MLIHDEMLLMLHLEPLDRLEKTAFAAACAQRLLPLSDRCARQVGDPLLEWRLGEIVSAAWQAAAGNDVDSTALASEAEAMILDEDDESWSHHRFQGVSSLEQTLPVEASTPLNPVTC